MLLRLSKNKCVPLGVQLSATLFERVGDPLILNIVPAVNQIEFSPWLNLQPELKWYQEKKCVLQSYSPLVRGKKFSDSVVVHLATKHGKTPAQIILRWNIQLGVSTIPKSSNPKRIDENFNIFDFQLSEDDMNALGNLNENYRVVEGPIELL